MCIQVCEKVYLFSVGPRTWLYPRGRSRRDSDRFQRGQPLDFGLGNFIVTAAGKDVHAQMLQAVQKVWSETKAEV